MDLKREITMNDSFLEQSFVGLKNLTNLSNAFISNALSYELLLKEFSLNYLKIFILYQIV